MKIRKNVMSANISSSVISQHAGCFEIIVYSCILSHSYTVLLQLYVRAFIYVSYVRL